MTDKWEGDFMRMKSVILCSAAAATLLYPGVASAQVDGQPGEPGEADSADQPSATLSEIVVTAQKRAESISKAPLAITAIGQNTLDDTGSKSVADAVKTIPSLQTTTVGNLAIRGIGTSIIIPSASPAVAFHVDGVYSATLDVISAPLWDIERIEVLRGPQGTLYGRNATAGVVNVISAKPVDGLRAFGDIAFGNFNDVTVRGVLNVPISDTLQVRASGQYEMSGGYQRNIYDNSGKGGQVNRFNGRLALKWQPIEQLTWNVNAALITDRGIVSTNVPNYYGAFVPSATPGNPPTPVAIPSGYSPRNIFLPADYLQTASSFEEANRAHRNVFDIRSNLRYDVTDSLSLSYIFGHEWLRETGRNIAFQITGTEEDRSYRAMSHEVNINLDTDRLHAVVGAYYFKNRDRNEGVLHISTPDLLTDPANAPPTFTGKIDQGVVGGISRQGTKAVFGQATYDITDRFRLTGGIRYNHDTIENEASLQSLCPYASTSNSQNPGVNPSGLDSAFSNGSTFCPTYANNVTIDSLFGTPLTLFGLPAQLPAQTAIALALGVPPGTFFIDKPLPGLATSFNKVSWKASADFDLTPDVLLYATVSTGFKTGGISTTTPAAGQSPFFNPETNINYEAGIRAKLFDNRVSANLTGFWTDYDQLQVGTIENDANNIPGNVYRNAGKARSRGLEFEGAWAITPSDRLSGFVTFLDARFTEFPNAADVFNTSPGGAPASIDAKGNRLPASPKWTFRAAYSHIFDLGTHGTLTPTIQTYHQSTAYTYYTNGPQDRIDPYWRSDLVIRYETRNKTFSVEGFVNNIEDKQVLTSSFPFNGFSLASYSLPRTYGIRIGVKFD
jgi:iron complex outermembrane receptor protein